MKMTGAESVSTMEVAALHALTYLCDIHQLEVGDSIARYFPVPSENNLVWGCRLHTVQDPQETAYNPTLAASVGYMGAMYNLRQKQEGEIKTLQGMMEQTKEKQFWCNLEKRMLESKIKNMNNHTERVMRYQLSQIDQLQAQLLSVTEERDKY